MTEQAKEKIVTLPNSGDQVYITGTVDSFGNTWGGNDYDIEITPSGEFITVDIESLQTQDFVSAIKNQERDRIVQLAQTLAHENRRIPIEYPEDRAAGNRALAQAVCLEAFVKLLLSEPQP